MQRGFTLIEILAVVTILAIAAVCAIPMVNSGYADVKLTAAARSVMADLFYAQNYAITTQNSVYVVITPSTASIGGKYTLQQSISGTMTTLTRPGGATFVVNLGKVSGTIVGTQLVDAKLGTVTINNGAALTNNTIGFDSLGELLNGASTTVATDKAAIPLLSPDGTLTMTLYIEAFTGEITVQ